MSPPRPPRVPDAEELPGEEELDPGFEPASGLDFFADAERLRPLTHPLRMSVYLEACAGAVSAKELAERFEQPLPRMSYHVRTLADGGLLKPVRRTRRRGAIETHYRAVARIEIDDATFYAADETFRVAFMTEAIARIALDQQRTLERDGVPREGLAIARAHLTLDEQGRREVGEALLGLYDRLQEIQDASDARVGTAGADGDGAVARAGVEPTNVVLSSYPGDRRAGANGPLLYWPGIDREMIPEQ